MAVDDLLIRHPVTDLRHRLTVRPAAMSDVSWLAQKVADLDRREIECSGDLDVREALVMSYEASLFAWSAVREERTLAMFGVGIENMVSGSGNPWFIMSGELRHSPRALLRIAPPYLTIMQRHFELLRGAVLDDHEPAKRFLSWLGFHLGAPFMANTGHVFRRFWRKEELN